MAAISGASLAAVSHVAVNTELIAQPHGAWSLRGVTGHVRYVERAEKTALDAHSPPLGRPDATCAALIPIRKSAEWWALPQDERRAIFETRSKHIADSMRYLPRIARRLYQARELGEDFDFLTWFEFAPDHAGAFDELVAMLRSREEWQFVEHEVEIRLVRADWA
jgi:chlorite dismutase